MTREEAIKIIENIPALRYEMDIEHSVHSDLANALYMAIEALKQPEIVQCKDCAYWSDEDGILKRSDGIRYARCTVHNYLIDGRHTGWCPTENDFCSFGERKDGESK